MAYEPVCVYERACGWVGNLFIYFLRGSCFPIGSSLQIKIVMSICVHRTWLVTIATAV